MDAPVGTEVLLAAFGSVGAIKVVVTLRYSKVEFGASNTVPFEGVRRELEFERSRLPAATSAALARVVFTEFSVTSLSSRSFVDRSDSGSNVRASDEGFIIHYVMLVVLPSSTRLDERRERKN